MNEFKIFGLGVLLVIGADVFVVYKFALVHVDREQYEHNNQP
jgi:hypothetical protein